MPLYPVGDPRRPLQLAIRSSRLLGLVFTILGMLVVGLTGTLGQRTRGGGFMPMILAALGFIYLIPGILYIVFSVFLARRQPWAVIATMILAALHGLFAVLALFAALAAQNPIQIGITALWVAAMAQLIFHLSKSFESMRAEQGEYAPRGFEPIQYGGNYPPPSPQA